MMSIVLRYEFRHLFSILNEERVSLILLEAALLNKTN